MSMYSVKDKPRFLFGMRLGLGSSHWHIQGIELETVPDETWCLIVKIGASLLFGVWRNVLAEE